MWGSGENSTILVFVPLNNIIKSTMMSNPTLPCIHASRFWVVLGPPSDSRLPYELIWDYLTLPQHQKLKRYSFIAIVNARRGKIEKRHGSWINSITWIIDGCCMPHGSWFMVYFSWSMAHGSRLMDHTLCSWLMPHSSWFMAPGSLSMVMAHGLWVMAEHGPCREPWAKSREP